MNNNEEQINLVTHAIVSLHATDGDRLELGLKAIAFTQNWASAHVYVEDVGTFAITKELYVQYYEGDIFGFPASTGKWYHDPDYYDPIKRQIFVYLDFGGAGLTKIKLEYVRFLWKTHASHDEEILSENVAPKNPTTGSHWLIKASDVIASGIATIGDTTVDNLGYAGNYYRTSKVGETDPNEKVVRPGELKTAQQVKGVTEKVQQGTDKVADFVQRQAFKVGKTMTDKMAQSIKNDTSTGGKRQAALNFGCTAMYAASIVLNAAGDAGMKVLTKASLETAECVGHSYGATAGAKASCASDSLIHTVKSAMNIYSMGPKGIVKGVFKEAGGNLIYVASDNEQPRTANPKKAYKNAVA